MQKVYVEWVLLDNFFMDFLLLFFAGRFLKRKNPLWRIGFGALLGAVYSALAFALPFLRLLPCKLAASFCMSLIANGKRRLFRFAIAMYLCTFVFGGAIFAAVALAHGKWPTSGIINAPVLRYLLMGGTAAVLLLEWILHRKYADGNFDYEIQASIAGQTVFLHGFLDTGNRLKDFSGGSVIIAEKEAVLSQLSPAVGQEILSFFQEGPLSIRPFYVQTIGGKRKIPGVLPDELILICNGTRYQASAYLALGEHVAGNGFQALIGPDLLLIAA